MQRFFVKHFDGQIISGPHKTMKEAMVAKNEAEHDPHGIWGHCDVVVELDKLKRSTDLTVMDIVRYLRALDIEADDFILWDDPSVMVENEDGQLVDIQAEQTRKGVVWIVYDMLDTGWMIENSFFPDGSVTRRKTR